MKTDGSGFGRRFREIKGECPICKHQGWCGISEDGTVVNCHRESRGSFRQKISASGTHCYFHRLKENGNGFPHRLGPDRPTVATPTTPPDRAGPDVLHEVYSALLEGLPLSHLHRRDLKGRGFPDSEIDRLGYRSVTRFLPRDLLSRLHKRFGDRLLSVPGFGIDHRSRLCLWCKPCLLIPVRDILGRIVALKRRPDVRREGDPKYLVLTSRRKGVGPSPGAPAHVPLGVTGPVEVVRITEGEVKADLATGLSGIPTVSAPGATNWKPALAAAEALGCKAVRIAFDRDLTAKKEVGASVRSLATAIRHRNLRLEYETWDPQHKGIDDALAVGATIEVVEGDEARQSIERDASQADPNGAQAFEEPDDPHRLARLFLESLHRHVDGLTLRRHRGAWWHWKDSRYQEVGDSDLAAMMNREIKSEFDSLWQLEFDEWAKANGAKPAEERKRSPRARKVHTRLVGDTLAALASRTLIPGGIEPPTWLVDPPPFPPNEILPCRNGVVHLPGLVAGKPAIVPPTPALFATYALDFDFDPGAPKPTEWLKFLSALWPGDPESIRALQEWFGLCLTADTSFQKIFVLIGPTRCGKGTIARILTALVGLANTAGPTLSGLATNFGAESMIGKPLAVIADARLTSRTDQGPILERLLSISGEDRITIDRKHREAWTGRMPTRLMILSNVLPKLLESSQAIVGRLVILRLVESFLGREDRRLEGRLRDELPGILLWSIGGWQRLHGRGRFVQPKSGEPLVEQMRDLTSRVGSFVVDRCHFDPSASIPTQDLYSAFRHWCEAKGSHPTSDEVFATHLYSVAPSVTKGRPRQGDQRTYTYFGIELAKTPTP